MSRRRALVACALAVLGACSDRKHAPAPAPTAALPSATASAGSAAPGSPAPAKQPVLPQATTQLVTAVVADWTTTSATVRLWHRVGSSWEPVGAPWPAVVGRSGSAWGVGLHGTGAPDHQDGPLKVEGDGKSPAGAFLLRAAYGYAEQPPAGSKLAYTSSGRGDLECVDDPGSEHYASIVDRKQVPTDWTSAEHMLRDDALYTWVVDVAHNPERAARRGSCIFLHVWSGPESSTLGCTAMEERRLVDLLRQLDRAARPAFVLLPQAEYRALAVAWGLPPQ